MSRKVIAPVGLPPSKSPLSPGIATGGYVFVSGQTAAECEGIEAQTRRVLEKMGEVLREAGSDFAHVARCGVYIKDMSTFAQMNAVYREFFPADPPARSTIKCDLAVPEVLVEIDCVASVP
jgi:aminoacrylate peracid reductase